MSQRYWVVFGVLAMFGAIYAAVLHLRELPVHTEYHAPDENALAAELSDDTAPEDSPPFDPDLVAPWRIGDREVNNSTAVFRLDCPMVKPDVEGWVLELRPSYAEAVAAAKAHGVELLPSASMLDGAAKQFDDGLYAAVDLACYRGALGMTPPLPDFFADWFAALPPGSQARPFLGAALELAGHEVSLNPDERQAKSQWLQEFMTDPVRSKPIGFYTWTDELESLWHFMRFLQCEFSGRTLDVPRALAAALAQPKNGALLEQYRAVNAFYSRLTNPLYVLPVDALIGTEASLAELAEQYGAREARVAVLPPSTSREVELILDYGIESNFMVAFLRAVRAGTVDLEPGPDDGWYQYQAYALESMLLPERVPEREKLVLSAKYKKRLVEAFAALVTKRRETHLRQGGVAAPEAPASQEIAQGELTPRFRIEPCATFYLRTARAYAFLEDFLVSVAGEARLQALHGLKEGGARELPLLEELRKLQRRFYGFYLVACEDLGIRPAFLDGEPVDRAAATAEALAWLDGIADDPDLAQDTRVAIPIFGWEKTTQWAALGVRLAPVETKYVLPPKIRAIDGDGNWEDLPAQYYASRRYLLPVQDFAEFALPGSQILTRGELRRICDKHKDKASILEALGGVQQAVRAREARITTAKP